MEKGSNGKRYAHIKFDLSKFNMSFYALYPLHTLVDKYQVQVLFKPIDNHHLDQTFKYKSRHVEDVATRLHTDYLNELQQLSLLQDITLHHETQENFKSYSFLWKANYHLKHCIRSTSQQTMAAKTFSEYSMNDSFNVTSPVYMFGIALFCSVSKCKFLQQFLLRICRLKFQLLQYSVLIGEDKLLAFCLSTSSTLPTSHKNYKVLSFSSLVG